jgi:hypothetical protein
MAQIAANGASAHHGRDGKRPTEVLTKRGVEHPPDAINAIEPLGIMAEQPAKPGDDAFAIEQHGDGRTSHDEHAGHVREQAVRRLLDGLVVDLRR